MLPIINVCVPAEVAPARAASQANMATSTQLNALLEMSTVHHFASFKTIDRRSGSNTDSRRCLSKTTTARA